MQRNRFYQRKVSFRRRLAAANKMSTADYFVKLTKDLPLTAKKIFWLQLRLLNKKPRGRRFSLDKKTLSLLLLKRSPKGYGLLQKKFSLPTRKN